jgi:hypothetical protein
VGKLPGPVGPDRFVQQGIGRTSAEHVGCVPVSIGVPIGMLAYGIPSRVPFASTHRDTFALLARGVKIAIAVRAIRLNSVPHLPSRLSALHCPSASRSVAYEVQSTCRCLCRRRRLPVGMTHRPDGVRWFTRFGTSRTQMMRAPSEDYGMDHPNIVGSGHHLFLWYWQGGFGWRLMEPKPLHRPT